jgi:hypothetical protein
MKYFNSCNLEQQYEIGQNHQPQKKIFYSSVEVTTVGDTLLCGLVEGERNGSGKARMKK